MGMSRAITWPICTGGPMSRGNQNHGYTPSCGQMSAWYVFSAMGFYPVCPGSDQYVIGSPLVKEAEIKLENGKTFTVKAENYADQNRYIKSIKLNGTPYHKSFITHSDIVKGGGI